MSSPKIPIALMSDLDRILAEPFDHVLARERSTFDRQLSDCSNRVVLFGAGNLGRKTLAALRSIGVEPLAFADNSPSRWGTEIDGLRVLSPEDAAARFGPSALFIVTIWSPGNFYHNTRNQLRTLGCRLVAPTITLRWKFADKFLPDFCLDLPHNLYEQAAEVRRAASLWEDERSRQEYLNQIRWRALGDQDALTPPDAEESYFLDSLYRLTPGEILVDCGAFDGDTIQQVIRRDPDFGRIFAIEAEAASFDKLKSCVAALDPLFSRRIELMNIAVGSKRGRLHFRTPGHAGARLAEDGEVVVECMPLDEVLANAAPTFIKMDIEGAEFGALEGARHCIQKYRPLLSICVYHTQTDLWRIPLFIRSLAEDYRMFLRPHDGDGWQLVCYAVPPDRLSA